MAASNPRAAQYLIEKSTFSSSAPTSVSEHQIAASQDSGVISPTLDQTKSPSPSLLSLAQVTAGAERDTKAVNTVNASLDVASPTKESNPSTPPPPYQQKLLEPNDDSLHSVLTQDSANADCADATNVEFAKELLDAQNQRDLALQEKGALEQKTRDLEDETGELKSQIAQLKYKISDLEGKTRVAAEDYTNQAALGLFGALRIRMTVYKWCLSGEGVKRWKLRPYELAGFYHTVLDGIQLILVSFTTDNDKGHPINANDRASCVLYTEDRQKLRDRTTRKDYCTTESNTVIGEHYVVAGRLSTKSFIDCDFNVEFVPPSKLRRFIPAQQLTMQSHVNILRKLESVGNLPNQLGVQLTAWDKGKSFEPWSMSLAQFYHAAREGALKRDPSLYLQT